MNVALEYTSLSISKKQLITKKGDNNVKRHLYTHTINIRRKKND